ncbi:MAG: 30S ribosomal protein S12 methylthiotransferase RimO [Oligoflexia bacterium]|nr:30S ribosomal protein S12 methylthiotransferase RimO [Oligoflexia bacterium]MBF0364753.1 30S ribosomal protein S12 methylthiotransferase RimO [Oligoflexia bacterium]
MSLSRFYFVALGCAKNLVDAEVMLGKLGGGGYQIVEHPESAEIIIINTCSFIDSAKEESIEVILEMAEYKKAGVGACKCVVVSGCMPQRYSEELEKELPEVDLFIGTGEYAKIVEYLKKLEKNPEQKKRSFVSVPKYLATDKDLRINTSPSYMAWLKIAEGCDRHCSFCIIPTIRGKYRSRTVTSLMKEAKLLEAQGVRELNLISQDISVYGKDLAERNNLQNLVKGLEKLPGIDWIRLLYYYPDKLDREFIEMMKNSSKLCHYVDMPVQHFSDGVLKRMNRKVTGGKLLQKIEMLKKGIPDIVLRTSVIVGFPGESDKDFQALLQGIEQAEFHNLGVFQYSDEEGTAAYKLKEKLPKKIINERFREVYKLQKKISKRLNKRYVGQTLDVLIEGSHHDTELLLQGRFYGQSPDIDGKVIINDGGSVTVGEIVKVKIAEAHDYDLVGEIVGRPSIKSIK